MVSWFNELRASNRLLSLSTSPQVLNAAGEHTQLGNLGLAYDSAGRLARTTHSEPVVSGGGARKPSMPFAPASHFYNGLNQRVLRENPVGQTVYVYGSHGHNVLGEYQPPPSASIRWSNGPSTEHVWLPTASGPMPVAAVINGEHFAVHSDHLNTPRRLTDRNGNPRWQWAYSGFGEIGPQSLTTATLPEVRLNLRYPGQIDDANGLFYNWHRFYQPVTGRYTKADPIGLDGGWNRFTYVGGNPLSGVDPEGLINLQIGGTSGETTVHANPGPSVTPPGSRSEHLPSHVHLGDNDGPRVRTDTFEPYSPDDERRMSRKQKKFCKGLTDAEKDLIRSRQTNVFNHGSAILKGLAGPMMLSPYAYCQADVGRCIDTIESIGGEFQ